MRFFIISTLFLLVLILISHITNAQHAIISDVEYKHGAESINIRPQQVTTFPLGEYAGQIIGSATISPVTDGGSGAIYVWTGSQWAGIHGDNISNVNIVNTTDIYVTNTNISNIYNSTNITEILQTIYQHMGGTRIMERIASTRDNSLEATQVTFTTNERIKNPDLSLLFNVDNDLASTFKEPDVIISGTNEVLIKEPIPLIDPYDGESLVVDVWLTYEKYDYYVEVD